VGRSIKNGGNREQAPVLTRVGKHTRGTSAFLIKTAFRLACALCPLPFVWQTSALAVPYLEVWYEDLLLDGDGSTLRKIEHFLDVGSSRLERERGERSTAFAVPTIPEHLAISKQTPVNTPQKAPPMPQAPHLS
jgi:hypothetical protein